MCKSRGDTLIYRIQNFVKLGRGSLGEQAFTPYFPLKSSSGPLSLVGILGKICYFCLSTLWGFFFPYDYVPSLFLNWNQFSNTTQGTLLNSPNIIECGMKAFSDYTTNSHNFKCLKCCHYYNVNGFNIRDKLPPFGN